MAWRPANGHHAIERASISLVFKHHLNPHQLNGLIDEITAVATSNGLTQAVILPPPVQFNFVQTGPVPAPVPVQVSSRPPVDRCAD